MQRSPLVSVAILVSLSFLAATPSAVAAPLTISSGELRLVIGEFPAVVFPQQPAPVVVAVSSGTGGFVQPAGMFAGTATLPTQLFTGISLFSAAFFSISQQTGTFSAAGGGGGGFGGPGPVGGFAALEVLGSLINLHVPLSVVGQGGVQTNGAAALQLTVTGARWTTGAAVVTGIVTRTTGGSIINTVTLTGYDNRTAGHFGVLQLVSPARILSNATTGLPLFAVQTLVFVPEVGPVALLLTAGVALLLAGRRSRR